MTSGRKGSIIEREVKSMPKTNTFTNAQREEVKEALKEAKNARLSRKLQVLDLGVRGYKNPEIATITGYSTSRVSALVCIYAKQGIGYFLQENRKSGNRRNMSYDEEAQLLARYEQQAMAGQIVETSEMKKAYEEQAGHRIGGQQIYRVLARHGWRKVMPRSKHPKKASEEAIEASKKLTYGWEKKEQMFRLSGFA
jgi:transposase